jgi:hypothetical protein
MNKIFENYFKQNLKENYDEEGQGRLASGRINEESMSYSPPGPIMKRSGYSAGGDRPEVVSIPGTDFANVNIGQGKFIYKWDDDDIDNWVDAVGDNQKQNVLKRIEEKAQAEHKKYIKLLDEFSGAFGNKNADTNVAQAEKDFPAGLPMPPQVALLKQRYSEFDQIQNNQAEYKKKLQFIASARPASYWDQEDASTADEKRYNAMMQKRKDEEELEKRRAAAVDAMRPGETSRSASPPTRVAPSRSLQGVREEINPISENYFKQNLNKNGRALVDMVRDLASALAKFRDKVDSKGGNLNVATVDIENIPERVGLEDEKELFRRYSSFQDAVIKKIPDFLSGVTKIDVVAPDVTGSADSDPINIMKRKIGAATNVRGVGVGKIHEEISLGQIVADEVNKALTEIPEIKMALTLISEQDDPSSQFTQELTNLIQKYGREIGMQVMGALEVDPEEEQTDLQAKISDVMANLGIQNT